MQAGAAHAPEEYNDILNIQRKDAGRTGSA